MIGLFGRISLALTLAIACAHCERPVHEYLAARRAGEYRDEVVWLERETLRRGLESEEELLEMLQDLEEALRLKLVGDPEAESKLSRFPSTTAVNREAGLYNLVSELIKLANPNREPSYKKTACSNEQVQVFLALAETIDVSLESLLAKVHFDQHEPVLMRYLLKYGPEAFGGCAESGNLPGEFVEREGRLDKHLLEHFDEMIVAISTSSQRRVLKEGPGSYVGRARQFDLTWDSFDVRKMYKGLLGDEHVRMEEKSNKSNRKLVDLMYRRCGPLRSTMQTLADLYNLGRALAPRRVPQMPVEFLKVNEYLRICAQLTNEKTRPFAVANIDRNYNEVKKSNSVNNLLKLIKLSRDEEQSTS